MTNARPRHGAFRLGATFVLVTLLLAGSGVGARLLLDQLWDRVVDYQSPYAQALPFEPTAGPGLSDSVVVFIVDGLRVDASKQMASLAALRRAGVSLVAIAEQPSLSLPSAATLATGTPPHIHGVTTNWYEGRIRVDSMFAAVRRAGLPTAFAGWEGWQQLYEPHIVHQMIPGPEKDYPGLHDRHVRDLALDYLDANAGAPKGLTIIYFSGTDDVGHSHGGASPEYLAEVMTVDGYIQELLEFIDLRATTVLLTADHGHIDTGGHGGWEPVVLEVPLVMAGRGIKTPSGSGQPGSADGPWPQVNQIDFAPTITALLGAGPPAHSLGLHLADWLGGDEAWQAQRAVAAASARARISSLVTAIGRGVVPQAVATAQAQLSAGDYGRALQGARDFLQAEANERARAVTGALTARQAARLPYAIGMLLAPLLLVLVMAKPPRGWATLVSAGLFFALFYGIYAYLRGLTYSFSAFNSEEQIMGFITMRLVEGAAIMIVTGLIGALMTRDLEYGARISAGLGALLTSVLVMWGLSAHFAWYYYQQGLIYPDYLPDFRMAFKTLVYLLTATGAGIAAVPTVLAALAAGGLGTARHTNRHWRYR